MTGDFTCSCFCFERLPDTRRVVINFQMTFFVYQSIANWWNNRERVSDPGSNSGWVYWAHCISFYGKVDKLYIL